MANHPFLLRGGQKIKVKKEEELIAMRTKSGELPEVASRSLDCEFHGRIYQQNLTVMSVTQGKSTQVLSDLKSSNDVSFAHPVFSIESDPLGQIFLTDEITIQFNPGTSIDAINQLAEENGLNYKKAVPGLTLCHVFSIASDNDPLALTNELLEKDEVQWCEPNIVVKSQNFFVPADLLFEAQWHLYHEGGVQLTPGAHVDAVKAWDTTKGIREIIIAIADDSIDINHPDLQGAGKIVAPRDFQGRDFNPSPERPEENHGTSVAGVAVAEINGSGVVGAAPGCALMPIRTTGYLDDNSVEVLFDYVRTNGAAIMSNSWGPAAANFPLSIRQDNAIKRCANNGRNGKGVMIFFASGNANRPVNAIVNETGWPNGELSGPTKWLDGFSTHSDVIAVSACTSMNKKSFYSNWGKEISVCAPSNNGHPGVGSSYTFPFVRGSFPGRGIVTTDRIGPAGYDASDFTFDFGGTSSACPLAAGVAGLILSANPNLTAKQARSILESTADKIVDTSTDPQLGFAYGDYDENGHSLWFGYGKVNAYKGVMKALELGGQQPPSQSGNNLVFNSKPNLAIPDNTASGISDTILVTAQGVVSNLSVQVNIRHTYVGDLVLTLIAPSGRSVILHNRNGGGNDNINQEFTSLNLPVLKELTGTAITGNWQLKVQDLARLDTGTLVEWGLKLETSNSVLKKYSEEPGVTIPDNSTTGLIRTLTAGLVGTIKTFKVGVDITHPFIADLVITLISADGIEIILHNRQGGSSDNINTVYTFDNTPALQQLAGVPAEGDYTLKVQDAAFQDIGKLNSWFIELELLSGV